MIFITINDLSISVSAMGENLGALQVSVWRCSNHSSSVDFLGGYSYYIIISGTMREGGIETIISTELIKFNVSRRYFLICATSFCFPIAIDFKSESRKMTN